MTENAEPHRQVSEQDLKDYVIARDRLPNDLADYIAKERAKHGSRIQKWFAELIRKLDAMGEALDSPADEDEDEQQ